jgi:UDP-2,3-diacylglucosamine hydrolase
MKAVFIADAHLKHTADEGYRSLMQFLDTIPEVDRLFIVGDFFDFWFYREGRVYPEFAAVVERMIRLKQGGVQIALCEGNHDFFMRSYFSDKLGMTVYADWAHVDLDGRRIFLSHGDTIDRSNRKYLFLRKVFRSKPFYHLQRIMPLTFLWKMAQFSSLASKELTIESQDLIAAKMETYSHSRFQEGFDAVVLGHCHKPLIKEYMLADRMRTFATLGDWIRHHSYLYLEDGRFELKYFPYLAPS